jgi:glycosyltransferase involved in cell wall biosynthesis
MSTFLLVKGLLQIGVPAIVVTASGSRAEKEALRRALPVATEQTPAKKRREIAGGLLKDIKALPERVKWLRSLGGEPIVHCSDSWIVQGWGSAAALVSAPVIYHQRKFVDPNLTNRVRIRLVSRFISISEVCRNNFIENMGAGYSDIVDVITNPFEISMPIGVEERREAGADITRIGFIGNFEIRKRPFFFLEIAAEILKQRGDCRFVMFGSEVDVSTEQLVAKAKELGIADRVSFPGFRTPPEANYSELDLLVAPALHEPFGRTLLESIFARTPYVATDDAGHSEIHSRWGGGYLVPKAVGADEFSRTALKALNEGGNMRLPERDLLRLAADLSPRSHAEAVLKVYKSIKGKADAGYR